MKYLIIAIVVMAAANTLPFAFNYWKYKRQHNDHDELEKMKPSTGGTIGGRQKKYPENISGTLYHENQKKGLNDNKIIDILRKSDGAKVYTHSSTTGTVLASLIANDISAVVLIADDDVEPGKVIICPEAKAQIVDVELQFGNLTKQERSAEPDDSD